MPDQLLSLPLPLLEAACPSTEAALICQECQNACLRTLAHCLDLRGEYAAREHQTLLTDCAAVCGLAHEFMQRQSPHSGSACEVCADLCVLCAHGCDRVADGDARMLHCAQACRRCAQECRITADSMR